jgi:hypothetical protein
VARTPPVALALALAALPAVPRALEPRFDHRDTHGPFVEALFAHDTRARSGEATESGWRSGLHGGWGFDVTGEGDELLVGAAVAVPWNDDPGTTRVLIAADARYRGYFGSEQLKTFFDVGIWAPLYRKLAVGPIVGIGVTWDFGRAAGVYAAAAFATAFGQERVASAAVSAGAQLRFDLP